MTRATHRVGSWMHTVDVLRASYRWVGPNAWSEQWTASCRLCPQSYKVAADFYEGLPSVGLLIKHHNTHLTGKRSEGGA